MLKIKKLEKLISINSSTQARPPSSLTEQTQPKPITSILANRSNRAEKKKKTVRFQEKTQLLNETSTKTPISEAIGHFMVEDLLDKSVTYPSMEIKHKPAPNQAAISSSLLSNASQKNSFISVDDVSSVDSRSNDTLILDEEPDAAIKPSFYEYDSILFPKANKYVDYLSVSTQDLSRLIDKEDNDETLSNEPQQKDQKESRRDKKILNSDIPCNETIHMTIMSMELHAISRANLHPNPDIDPIGFIIYTVYNQKPTSQNLFDRAQFESHLIIFDKEKRSLATKRYLGYSSEQAAATRFASVSYAHKEEELFDFVLEAVSAYDPDILLGFEIQKLSWCYLVRRAIALNVSDFFPRLSRLPKSKRESVMRISLAKPSAKPNKPTVEIASVPHELVIAGRVVLNLWRILRSEISLSIYTFENCCFSILNERVAKFSFALLTSWFAHRSDLHRSKTIDYYLYRAQTNLRLISSIDLIGKTSEFAKVYGIEFYHVLLRGSQYRVESMMLRIARKLDYVAFSANQKQKALMKAAECLPLTLEPESRFYTEPIAVLDFQSLYPSVIIAYNICYTTCLGRVESIGKEGSFRFGCGSLFVPDGLIKSLDLDRDIYVAPNGEFCFF
jgi:DNA polymerase elongation subunit (family B)